MSLQGFLKMEEGGRRRESLRDGPTEGQNDAMWRPDLPLLALEMEEGGRELRNMVSLKNMGAGKDKEIDFPLNLQGKHTAQFTPWV